MNCFNAFTRSQGSIMKRSILSILVVFLVMWTRTGVPVRAQSPGPSARLLEGIEAKRQAYADIALQIWRSPELGFLEEKSSALLQEKLSEAGFAVKKGVADIPTAFVASYGSGKPVIAFIGEFDALPGLSQEAVPERKPVATGAPGHGCGHNLLGTAAMAAAIAVKDWLVSGAHAGTIRFYGTPAEEGGGAKVYMVRAGLFDDVDVAVSWHPGDTNDASPSPRTLRLRRNAADRHSTPSKPWTTWST
jgi:aminobenzoyl-glutamate utilization protein B